MPQVNTATITTFAGDCTTPKTVFGPNETVCVAVTGLTSGRRLIWSDANNNVAALNLTIGATNTFQLSSTPSLGDWRVIVYEPFGGTVQAFESFTVEGTIASADLIVNEIPIVGKVAAGEQVVFGVYAANYGPSTASNVHLEVDVPLARVPDANAEEGFSDAPAQFISITQLGGPTFTCPPPGQNQNVTCDIASMPRGSKALFLATFQVPSGAVLNSRVSTASAISSGTTELNERNNSSSTAAVVTSAPCVLTPPANITTDAPSGQAGVVVDYDAPTSTGECGQSSIGDAGESTEAISCSPASGSFFPIGTTTVVCTGKIDGIATFQVTVNTSGALSISLNGADTITHECGSSFSDPGATAVNAAGQSVPVTVSGATIDRDTPTGTYTITYTASDGTDSISTPRTVNVVDTQPPAITVEGANPYKIPQGSCIPFVDPGASANDSCAGQRSVSSSISGPNGLTAIDNSVPGTYVITYTATDGTRQATAKRKVVVGQFSEDESDLPDTGAITPTLKLNGDEEMTIECGSTFNDPGATAMICQTPTDVTTSGTVDSHTPGTYTITYTATNDADPNHPLPAQKTRTVNVEDTAGPSITINGNPSNNTMTVECHTSFTDPGATAHDACEGDSPATASGSVDVNTVGTYTIEYTASDSGGHPGTPVTLTVNVVDTTPPNVTPPATVTLYTGAAGTSCGVTVNDLDATLGTASASDACEGALPTTRSGVPSDNVFPVGPTTLTYTATDAHNNPGSATQIVIVVDNTPPTLNAPNITVSNDAGSCSAIVNFTGLSATDNCGTANITTSVPSGTSFPKGTTTVTATATDGAGNTTTKEFTVTVNDTEAPTITYPASVEVNLPLNSTATSMAVTYTVTAADNCPGVTLSVNPPSGSVFPVGPTTVTATATDAAGNTTTRSFTVTVRYNFTGFFSPVGNLPMLNQVNAGRAIPTKFSLSGNKGLSIFAAGYPVSQQITCDTGAPVADVSETVTAGGSSLSYSPDQYNYVWKTEGSWAGTCRQLIIKLNDGTEHRANFKFK